MPAQPARRVRAISAREKSPGRLGTKPTCRTRRLPFWPTISPTDAPVRESWSRNVSPESPIPQARGSAPSFTSTRMLRLRLPTRWIDLRKANAAPSRYAGIPVSIKDLFDIKGQVTRAGSRALDDSAPADGRCTCGGAAACGRLCRDRPHQHDRVRLFRHRHQSALRHAERRLAAQRRAMCPAARPRARRYRSPTAWPMARSAPTPAAPAGFPAAFNGIVGYKPTQRRVPLDGGVPLSSSLDSFGPLANSVACCAALDAVLANEAAPPLQPRPIKGMRLAVPTTVALDDLDDAVAKTFERVLQTLSKAGALIEHIEVPEFLDVGMMNAKGGFSAAESLCLASLPDRSQGRHLRSARVRAHHARRSAQRGRLCRPAQRAALADRAHRDAACALRCAGAADHGEHAAAHRRSHRRRQDVCHRKICARCAIAR